LPHSVFTHTSVTLRRTQWPRSLRRGSAASRMLRFWV
jgi:hypothetical protein